MGVQLIVIVITICLVSATLLATVVCSLLVLGPGLVFGSKINVWLESRISDVS